MVDVQYVDRNGDKHDPEDVEDMWRMESILIEFECPLCGRPEETTVEGTTFETYDTALCHECEYDYRLEPLYMDEDDASVEDRVEKQLDAVRHIHPVVFNGYFREVMFLTVAPKFFVAGVIPLILQLIGTYILVTSILGASFSLVGVIGAVTVVATAFFALYSFINGPARWFWNGYRAYRSQDEIDSFPEFIKQAANFWGLDPYSFNDP